MVFVLLKSETICLFLDMSQKHQLNEIGLNADMSRKHQLNED